MTERLTPKKAVQTYGRITEVIVGRQGGFQSVTYGTKKFVCRLVDPRGSGLYDDSIVLVNDPIRDNHECLACGAAPGAPCLNDKGHDRGNHRNRSDGRTRWDIEKAENEARAAREKAEAAQQWEQDMATPPELRGPLGLKRWKWSDDPRVFERVQDASDWFTVEQTYANRTVLVPVQMTRRPSWHATSTPATGRSSADRQRPHAFPAGTNYHAAPATRPDSHCTKENRGSEHH
ncbi:hypothetical protein E1263_27525 [Kribbella antibiotica]|uniref:DNA-binding phage zinc finger domain-containing protein n=1 Tax=Kribbella antibiotica TaxID=190195 RepID=A0A4V2YNC5_9ACTN|nr:hypothetical protein [Kribbella antibiotica]TDD53847.1 hypothetical protein E1263_27525 [Kribbella antibiotica]